MKQLNILSKSFIFIIFFVLIFIVIKTGLVELKIITFYKGDNWKVVEKSDDPIYDKVMSLETNVENRINNYFPLYQNINSIYYNSIMNIDSLYLNDIYLKNNSDDEKLFYNKSNRNYFIVSNYSDSELNNRLSTQIDFYNNLVNKYKDINFYIYMPLRYEIVNNINDINNKLELFKSKLNSSIKVDTLGSKDNEEYFNYFYRTDHHYNANGALKAYRDISNLLGFVDNNDYKIKEVVSPYYGSMSKSLLSTKISDKLYAIDSNRYVDVNISDSKFKPLNIVKRNYDFYDYYVGYFDGQYDEVIYTNNDSNTNNNLLIISDSLAWQIDYLIANNYNKTYVINFRYGKWIKNNLDLDKYLKDNNIKNVLFLQEAEVEMFDIYNFNTAKKVI